MDLPLCKICGERHRLGFCPKFGDPAAERRKWLAGMLKETPNAAKTARAPQAVEHHQAQEAGTDQAPAPPQVKPKFDKNAYQRELMRKRRAAAKLKPA